MKSIYGFKKVEKVTKAVLRERITMLTKAIEDGKWDKNPDKRFGAIKLAAYYRWQLAHFDEKKAKPAKKKSATRAA